MALGNSNGATDLAIMAITCLARSMALASFYLTTGNIITSIGKMAGKMVKEHFTANKAKSLKKEYGRMEFSGTPELF